MSEKSKYRGYTTEIEMLVKMAAGERGLSFHSLCKSIGMSDNGLNAALQKNTIRVETLFKIAEVLNLEIYYLLPTDKHDYGATGYREISSQLRFERQMREQMREKYYQLLEENRELRLRLEGSSDNTSDK